MATSYSTLFFVVVIVVISNLATLVCSSYNFAKENPIKSLLDGPNDNVMLDYSHDNPFFSRSILIEAIYQFGDSISDTGNLIRYDPSDHCGKWPYGRTYFNKPTGRCSDGLLMIDYFATFLNLPLIDPYLNKDGDFTHGVNFAVAGGTALNNSTLNEKYDVYSVTGLSLSVQLGWFNSYLDSLSLDKTERRKKLVKGLFFMGEVGGNDYIYAFYEGKTLENVYKMVPGIVQAIKSGVEEIIKLGAINIVVPGNFAIGCLPVLLDLFKTNDSSMYDEFKCLKEYNNHAQFHNDLLQENILELQKHHPNVTIVYLDYFGALKELIRDVTSLGFDENALLEPCCGDGRQKICGINEVIGCENPQERISWDGVHFTQRAYHIMANKLMHHILSAFQIVPLKCRENICQS